MNATTKIRAADKPLIQTIEMLSAGQQAAIRRIAPHDQAPIPKLEATRPVSAYIGQEQFEREQANLFRKRAVPLTISARLPEPGMALAQDAYGLPLLVTRDKQGQVRVFLNACTHKGAKLTESCEAINGSRLSCPYHAWTFGVDGSLISAARPETFANFDKSKRNLAELPSREAGGIIWVMLDRKAEPDFSGMNDDLTADLEAFDLPTLHVYGHKTFHLKANWKAVLEPFLEGYHVQRLHASTVGPLFADTPNVLDTLGDNIRQISGKLQFMPAYLDEPGANIHGSVTHAYNVFPNCVVVTSPYYISVMFIMPLSVDESRVEYFFLTRRPPDNPKGAALYEKSFEMVVNVFGNEDYWAAEMSHAGMKTGAIDDVVFSGMEATIPIYYDILDRVVG